MLILVWCATTACGGTVVFEEDGGAGGAGGRASSDDAGAITAAAPSSGSGAATGTATSVQASTAVSVGQGSSSATGGTASASDASSSSGGGGCEGQACGTPCEICPEGCGGGFCDLHGSCTPYFRDEPSPCPPVEEVVPGGACGPEGAWCASEQSCSGALSCICGAWTLINPC